MNINIAWLWYDFVYRISPTFTNHLRAQWYHYKFCKRRAEVFHLQIYISQWKQHIEKIINKSPGSTIPNQGFYAILKMITNQQLHEITFFFENENIEGAISIFIQKLNFSNDEIRHQIDISPTKNGMPETQKPQVMEAITIESRDDQNLSNDENKQEERSNLPKEDSKKIETRTYVIAMQIYYELFRTDAEYAELKISPALYIDAVRLTFHPKKLPKSIYSLRGFDYRTVLSNPESSNQERNVLHKQFMQIINHPIVFGKSIVQKVKNLKRQHFGNM